MKLLKLFSKGLVVLAFALANLAMMTPNLHATTLNPPYTSVQLFKWSWNDIATECTQWLGPQGYGGVQISPPSAALSNGNWWDMYQPVNYTSLTSVMGTASQLQSMINTCHAAGVRVYADIVVNQMAGGSGTATDGSTWNANSDTALQYPYFSTPDFHTYCPITSEDYDDSTYDVQHCWLLGLPDLATESSYVQSQIENYLELLLSMGVDGFRMDAAKHQQEDQLAIIFAAVDSAYPTTLEGEPIWVTQEIIPDGEVDRVSYEALGAVQEFQFTYALQYAFRDDGYSPSSIPTMMGTPGNWGGSWDFLTSSNAAQIFVDDWDTERNDGGSLNASDYVSGDPNDAVGTYRYDLGNIFMLAQPYGVMAQVQSGFRFTGENQDMPSTSAFSNGVAQVPPNRTQNYGWDFIHRWPDISNMVNFRTATYGLSESAWTIGTADQIAFSRGNVGFVALNNDRSNVWNTTFQTGLPAGTYCNVVNGVLSGGTCTADTVAVNSSGQATLSIPANGGSVVPAVAIYTGEIQAHTAPATPTGLTGSVSGTTVSLSWTADSGATSYTVYRSTSSASGFASIAASATNSYNDSSVTAGTTYYYFITASNSAGTSGNSSTVAVPVSLYSSLWANMYLRGTMNNWGTTAMTLIANDTWQVTVALAASTSYSYKYDASGVWTTNENWGVGSSSGVAALNAGNISYTSGSAGNYVFQFNDSTLAYTVTTPSLSAPSTPTGLTATGTSSSTMSLAWTASTGATSYIVYRSTSASGPFTTSVGTPAASSFSDSGLTASTTYYYEVAAVNSVGTSANTAAVPGTTLSSSSCTTVAVTFTIANADTTYGQNLYVAGNQTALGNWTPASAFALNIEGSGANVPWTGTVQLPPNTAIQYKYIKYNPSTGAVVWEANQSTSSGNRQQTTAPCGSTSSFNDGNF